VVEEDDHIGVTTLVDDSRVRKQEVVVVCHGGLKVDKLLCQSGSLSKDDSKNISSLLIMFKESTYVILSVSLSLKMV
jgi:hypothetical protein